MRLPLKLLVTVATVITLSPLCTSSPLYQVNKLNEQTQSEEATQTFWKKIAQDELHRAVRVTKNQRKAKNVIMFLGDGMSIPTVTAGRIYKGQRDKAASAERGTLAFEQFPHVALIKTYNADKQVPDSASTATAYLGGVKTNYYTLGVDASAQYQNCSSVHDKNKVHSIVKWAQDAKKMTGVITSTRITHATPGATYAHVADRDWESDAKIPRSCLNVTKDIARQLVEDEPGRSINVIMGGGYQCLNANANDTEVDDVDNYMLRKDKKDLTEVWKKDKKDAGAKYAFVRTKSGLADVKTEEVEYLMGIFANGHLPYEEEKKARKLDVPTLATMTEAAIKVLRKGENGFFLLVEGGRIDHAHHATTAHRALDEVAAMDDAVEVALKLTDEDDTLIVVTADHAHTMSISGYPHRGNDILGIAKYDSDGYSYTTLMYGNGPGYHTNRTNLTEAEYTDWEYEQRAAVPLTSETHGGDDVSIFALGPKAHLFHGLHEQNYIPHVMAYAACIGDYTGDNCSGAGMAVPTFTIAIITSVVCLFSR